MVALSSFALEGVVEGLETVLVDNRDDALTHRAYADVLLRHREPARAARGKFIEAQLRLEENTSAEERKKLEGRQRKLLRDHGRVWLGELAPYLIDQQGAPAKTPYQFALWRGWLDRVVIPSLSMDFARTLARSPAARLLRVLTIVEVQPGAEAALAELRNAPFLPHLRELRVGGEGGEMQTGQAAELLGRLARPAAA
jgi:hypothetical protein